MKSKLLDLNSWLSNRFSHPLPSIRTAQNWCEKGAIPAKKIGGRWFVYHEKEAMETGNELVDSVLNGK